MYYRSLGRKTTLNLKPQRNILTKNLGHRTVADQPRQGHFRYYLSQLVPDLSRRVPVPVLASSSFKNTVLNLVLETVCTHTVAGWRLLVLVLATKTCIPRLIYNCSTVPVRAVCGYGFINDFPYKIFWSNISYLGHCTSILDGQPRPLQVKNLGHCTC